MAAEVIAAIPLKPAAGIVRINPSLFAPDRQPLAGIDAKIVEATIAAVLCELGARKPVARELFGAVGEVFAAEHAKPQHFRRCQFGPEFGIEVPPDGRGEDTAVAALHFVVDDDGSLAHRAHPACPIGSVRLVRSSQCIEK
jgi:hypothetical protein